MSSSRQPTRSSAPTIAIATIVLDDVLNAPEAQPNLTIRGITSGVEDGQHVTVTLNDKSYDAVVSANTWSASVTVADLMRAVPPDGGYKVTASVSNKAGSLAMSATQTGKLRENLLPLTPGQARELEQAVLESKQGMSKQGAPAPVSPPPYQPALTKEQRVAAIAKGLWPTGRPPDTLVNKAALRELENYCKTHGIALDFVKDSQILRAFGRKK